MDHVNEHADPINDPCACRDCARSAPGPLGTLCPECTEAGCDAFYCDCQATPQTHWGYGSGMPGCLFDHGPHFCETQDDAINSALWLFSETGNETDLSESELEQARADLKADGIHYFPAERRGELGASLVQVWLEPGPCPEQDD